MTDQHRSLHAHAAAAIAAIALFAPAVSPLRAGTSPKTSRPTQVFSKKSQSKLAAINAKLQSIVIDEMSFEDLAVTEIIAVLRRRSQNADADKTGVNMMLLLTPEEADRTLTVHTGKISLADAIRYVCISTGLSYRIDPSVVVITGKGRAADLMQTQFYPLNAGWVFADGSKKETKDLQAFFDDKGVTFPPGARVAYYQRQSLLGITNTAENQRKVARLLKELGLQD